MVQARGESRNFTGLVHYFASWDIICVYFESSRCWNVQEGKGMAGAREAAGNLKG